MRLELTRVGFLVELANHYTTRGPDPIIWLVWSSPSTYLIVPTVFFKLLWWNPNLFYFKGARKWWLRVAYAEIAITEII